MIKKNAIILAAGKSNKFAPFTYEKPKGLFCIRGQVLIERQIEQLLESGISSIYIVVGYMKEKFFYLEQKYGVKLIVNNEFGTKGNLYTLYTARKYLCNSFICCADHYFVENPFFDNNNDNVSYRACTYQEGKFREFSISVSDAKVITDVSVGGSNSYAMIGQAYMNESFSKRFCKYMENEINDFGVSSMFWEEFYKKHIKDLTFYMKEYSSNKILEFENIDDLRKFDSDFLLNVDSEIISNICKTLNCYPNEIYDIDVINAGLTNVSFSFFLRNKKFVYRHPGGTAGNLINRETECYAQNVAKEIGIDTSFIKMDISGWKLSYFVENAKNCDFDKSNNQLKVAMEYLHRLHNIQVEDSNVKIFDNVIEGKRLMSIASATKGHLEKEFKDLISKIDHLYKFIKLDAERLNYKLVLCHNDIYAPNYLIDKDDKIYLIDWEYAGLNYAANDIGGILCRYDLTDKQIDRYLEYYFGRKLSYDERRFYYAFIPISGFYWFCWGLYKGSVGDDDSFFFLPSYRNTIRFIDKALDSYSNYYLIDKEKC